MQGMENAATLAGGSTTSRDAEAAEKGALR